MCAPAHAFAVGVEDQGGNIGQAVVLHRLRKAALKPLNRKAGRDLPDKPSGIGKAGLDACATAQADIVAVLLFRAERFEEASAVLKRAFGFEQR